MLEHGSQAGHTQWLNFAESVIIKKRSREIIAGQFHVIKKRKILTGEGQFYSSLGDS